MNRFKLLIPIFIFSILLSLTSVIKNKTRVIEKKTYKINKNINILKKDLSETQLDFTYLSSPNYLDIKIKEINLIDYFPMEFSKLYLTYEEFENAQKKISTLKENNEKKIKKR